MSFLAIKVDAALRSAALIDRRDLIAFLRNRSIEVDCLPFAPKLILNQRLIKRRRLPPVPLPTIALEPEQQVGPAVAAIGLLKNQPCSNAADSARPRGKDLGSKGIQVDIEHCRRRLFGCHSVTD